MAAEPLNQRDLVEAGAVDPGLDYKTAYTTEFVGKGLGKEIAK